MKAGTKRCVIESRGLEPLQTHPALRRSMGLSHATAMVAGIILGASIFVQPSEISQLVPSVTGMMLVWLLAGVLTLCGALVCAELSAAFPQTGGVYVFLKEVFSPAVGFTWGWAMFWIAHSGIIAAMSVIFARYVGYFVPLGNTGGRTIAIAGIAILSTVNYFGVRPGSGVQLALTSAKVIAIVLMLGLFFALGSTAKDSTAPDMTKDNFEIGWHGFLLALSAALFTYGGWHMVTYTAGETRDPNRTIPKALLLGTLVVTVCYLGLNAAFLHVLPLARVMSSTRVAADAAEAMFGPQGGAAISALVIVSSFSALNGVILAGPRVYAAMAHDGLAFRWLGAIHERYQTPHFAIAVQGLWAAVLVASDSYRNLFTRVIYTEWIFFALLGIGVFRLRQRSGTSPVFSSWMISVATALFIVASLMVVANQVAARPLASATGLLLVAMGFPVYYIWTRRMHGGTNASD